MVYKTSLSHWQASFSQSLLQDLQDELKKSAISPSENTTEKRFSIYQNNVFYSLSNALADLYPVVKKLVGDDFFAGTADYYLRQHPPQQAAMVHFANDFPQFLSQFEHTRTMTFIAPIATLELARHKAYHAKDETAVDINEIAHIEPELLTNATFTLQTSAHLLASQHPIFTIWQENQKDDDNELQTIDLDEPQYVLVVRPEYEVTMYNIDYGTYLFLDLLKQQRTLSEAIELTMQEVDDFDSSHALLWLLQTKMMTSININKL